MPMRNYKLNTWGFPKKKLAAAPLRALIVIPPEVDLIEPTAAGRVLYDGENSGAGG